jgi:hypothetical protein
MYFSFKILYPFFIACVTLSMCVGGVSLSYFLQIGDYEIQWGLH